MSRRVAIPLAFLWAPIGALWAQDQPKEKYEIQAWHMETWKDKDGADVTYLSGQVRVTSSTMELRADRVIAWKRPDSPFGGTFDEMYAEGFVSLKSKSGLTESERIFMDLAKERALSVEFVFRGKSSDPPTGFVIRAQEVVRLGRDRYVADKVSVSSCTFATPHFDVTLSQAMVRILSNPLAEAGRAIELIPQFSEVHIQGEDILGRIGPFPFFYFPGFSYELGMEFLIRRITVGQSRRFGWNVYTDWGFPLYRTQSTPKGEERIRYADVAWKLDWTEKRGFAGGFFPRWELPWMWGYLDSYAMYDLGPDFDIGFERQFMPFIRHERGRARLFDRIFLSDEWRLDLEASYISDRNFLPEIFRQEFLTGKEQETTIYLRWMDDNMAAVGQGKYRLNPFQSQVEQLPRTEYFWLGEPLAFLLDEVHYSQNTQLANLRFIPDTAQAPGVFQTWRFDTQHELFLPLDFDLFQMNWFTLGRYTAYQHNVLREEDDRLALTAGADLSATITGIHSLRSELLGMRDLRHIIHVRGSYAHNLFVTRGPTHFRPLDPRDALNEFEEVSMELRQHFQTKLVGPDGQERSHEFLKITAEIEYYPFHTRDASTFNVNSAVYPFNWLIATPPAAAALEPRKFSNLWWTAQFTPAWILSFNASGEINVTEGADEYRTLAIGLTPLPALTFTLGHTYLKHGTDTYLAMGQWSIGPHWTLGASITYDQRQDIFLNSTFDVIRTFHDFVVMVRFSYDAGEDEYETFFTIQPKIFRDVGYTSKLR